MVAQVAIDGLDGSGKSRFADALARACAGQGMPATVVRVDDFRRPEVLVGVDETHETDAYYQGYYDFAAVDRRLAEAAASQERAGAALIIVEGVFVLRSRVAASAPLVVLEVDREVALARIRTRDAAAGRGNDEIDRRIHRRYLPAQDRYRAAFDPVRRAALVVDNSDWAAPRVVRRVAGTFPEALERAFDRLLAPPARPTHV
jgi:uridine kinase